MSLRSYDSLLRRQWRPSCAKLTWLVDMDTGTPRKNSFALMLNYFEPARERRRELLNDLDYVHDVLRQGAKNARAVANACMERVRELTGLMTTYS